MILHRLVVLFGTVAVVVVACSTEGRKHNNDDGNTSNNASASTGPGPTEKCEDQCAMEHPAGVELYTNLRKCLLCYACANVCKTEQGGTCTEGIVEGGCSAQSMTCTECLNSPCALIQNPDTTFAGKCAETGNADACAANMDCVGMNNCVATCVAMQTTSSTGSMMTSSGSMTSTGTMTSTGSM